MHKRYSFFLTIVALYTGAITRLEASSGNLVTIDVTDPVDYAFFNNKTFSEQTLQPITRSYTQENTIAEPIIDPTESQDVDFSFFNDPYAFETFQNKPIQAKFSGYIEYVTWWANRQGVGDGDVFEVVYPERPIFDADCRDIHAQGDSNMTVLDTRLRAEFFGPRICGAETFGFIESDAFGSSFVLQRFRIWHAFMQLTWQTSKILLGQFWHPFSVVSTFPPTVTVDNGSPITPNCRNPQIRYTYMRGNTKILIAALAQQEFASEGPQGHSSIYLRNARVPILVTRAVYDDKERIYAGAGVLFQRLKPRIESDTGYKVNESINSVQATLFATIKFKPFEIRQQLTYAQNGNDLNLLGGFAVTHIDPVTDERKYTNISALSYWIDLNINKAIEPGMYIGIIKNLGSRQDITQCVEDPSTGIETSTIYSQGPDIKTVFKCYPRIRFHVAPVDFAFEFEITRATYGCINVQGKVKRTDPTTLVRALFASYYYF